MRRGGGVAIGQRRCKHLEGPVVCSVGKVLESLDCFGLHFAHFHGG